MDRLQLLKQLFEDGFIGHEEFITRKTQLIDDLTFTRSTPLNNNNNSHHAPTNLKDVNITTTINPRSTHDDDDFPLSPKTPDLLFESFFPDSPISSCAASTVDAFPPLLSPSSPFFTDLLSAPTSTCATTTTTNTSTNTTTASLGSSTTVVEGDNDDCAAFLLYDEILTSDCQHRAQTTVACRDNDHSVTVVETRDVEKSKDSTSTASSTTTIDSTLSHDDLLALSPLSPISSSQVTPGTLFEMSVEQKKQMIEKLKQLSRVSQVKILQFLQMKSPSQLQKNDSLDEYTCDLGCVDNQTCLTLYHMITELEMLELYQSNVQYYQQQQQQQYFPFYSAFAAMNPSMDLASYSNNLQPWYNQSQYSSSVPNMMMMNTLETPQPENNNQSKKKRRRNIHDNDDDDEQETVVNKKQRMNTSSDQQSEQLPKKKHASDEWPLIDSCSHDHQPVSHLDASDVCSFMLPTTTMNCEQALWKPSKTCPSQQLTSDTTTLYTNPSCSDTVDCGSSLHPPVNNQEDPAKKKFTITLEIHTFDKADDTNKPYHCDTCGKRFKDRSNLAKHIRVHTKEKPFTCDICGNSYAHSQTLREHMFVHRKDEHDNTVAAKPFQCTFKSCNKTFANEANLRRHMRTHTKEQPYECHLCERSFSQSGNLKTHLKLVHQLIVDKITKKEQKHKRMLRLTKSLDME